MKIIIAGYGFVGKAVFNALKNKHEVVIVDPQYNNTLVEHHLDADGIIICVPTPSLENGGCDCRHIANVLDTVPIFMPALIKSTVTPVVVETLHEIYKDHSLTYSPEFLRANTADSDFINQSFAVIGGEDPEFFWQDLLSTVLDKCKIYFTCSDVEASMVKYTVNSFLATKVAFFNNLYDLCQANGAEYSIVRQIVTQDTRIGSSHTLVPGVNGERGFGGHCFPKDTEALLHYANSIGVNLDVLKSVVESNQTARKSLDI
jgi:UDPglucose 6-dehydrogenase